jgi:hypothetical protein
MAEGEDGVAVPEVALALNQFPPDDVEAANA